MDTQGTVRTIDILDASTQERIFKIIIGALASNVTFNDNIAGLGASNVQEAIEALASGGLGVGIDTFPADGSGNLVTSGGVFSALAQIRALTESPFDGVKIASLGDSFSAPGAWQSAMRTILKAASGGNKAKSGGAWKGTDELSAYAQAQALVASLGDDAEDYNGYVLCVFGTNDVNNNQPLGDIVNSQTIGTDSGDINPSASITGGVQACLQYLKVNMPDAIIKIGYTPAGYIHDNFSTRAASAALCERLKEVALIYGVGYIETRDCGINPYMDEDKHAYTGTGDWEQGTWQGTGHPSAAGQQRIGEYMARKMMCNR